MKFDPYAWHEVKANEKTYSRKGWLRVRASATAPLYVEAEGVEVLIGVGTEWDVEITSPVKFWVDTPAKGVRVFYSVPRNAVYEPEGEIFTNIDRMSDESGNLLEVRRALRELELARRATLDEIRAERADVLARQAAVAASEAVSQPPAPAPELGAQAEANQ